MLILRRAIYIISLLGAGRFNAILIIVLDVAFEEAVLPLEGITRTCVGQAILCVCYFILTVHFFLIRSFSFKRDHVRLMKEF